MTGAELGLDPHAMRVELEALEGLVNSSGWARFLEAHAERVMDCQEKLSDPMLGEREHTMWATEIQVLKAAAVWPTERAVFLREMIGVGGD